MANLAIRGHNTRGKEVIEILEMLGGINRKNSWGVFEHRIHFINAFGDIEDRRLKDNSNYQVYTLEEFIKKFPYKIGDMVRVYEFESEVRIDDMKWVGCDIHYQVFTDATEWYTAEELNELNKPYKEQKTMEEQIKIDIPEGYKFSGIDNQQVVFEKVKPKYPKDFEECCHILEANVDAYFDHEDPYSNDYEFGLEKKLLCLRKLLICRGAYWKLAGEQLGLDKPWEPDWKDSNFKYCLKKMGDNIEKTSEMTISCILAFPTEEMRDAFFENFGYLIEICKELL